MSLSKSTKPSSPSTPDVLEVSTGAFVLPNAIIPDEAKLENFVVPGTTLRRTFQLSSRADIFDS